MHMSTNISQLDKIIGIPGSSLSPASVFSPVMAGHLGEAEVSKLGLPS